MPNYKEFEGINLITDPIKKIICKLLLRVFVTIILFFGIFCKGVSAADVHQYSEKECLALTEKDKTYDNSTKHILKLKMVTEFSKLLKNDKKNKVSLVFFFSEPRYIKHNCFWYIRLEENHETHMVYWKSFLVDIGGANIYEESADSDSYNIVK